MLLKCLSIRQPYCAAILTGQKTEEFRSKRTLYRGLLAIHAPLTLAVGGFSDFPNFRADKVVTGAVLGLVELVDCQEEVYGDSFAWILARPRWLKRPLSLKGKLNLFTVEIPDELLPAELAEMLASGK